MATTVLTQHTLNAPLNGTTVNANLQLIEDSFTDLGPYVISGLVPTATAGLAVSVSSGVADIGGRVTKGASFNITGLTDATTNYLYLLNTGSGTSNTTGTAPANSVRLGTATTAGGVVTSVNTLRSSGRQLFVRPENQVPGAVGSMGSINLANWAAAAADNVPVFGTLPSGAVTGITRAVTTKTANYTATYADNVILANANAGGFTVTLPTAVGHSGSDFSIKRIDSSANVVHIQTTGGQTIDGVAPPRDLTSPFIAVTLISDGSNWWII